MQLICAFVFAYVKKQFSHLTFHNSKLTGVRSGISTLSSLVWLMVLLDAGELSLVCPGRPLFDGVEGSMFSVSRLTFSRSMWGGSKFVPVVMQLQNG